MKPIRISMPYEELNFIPAGCIHWPIGEKDLLLDWVKEMRESKNSFTVLMGDTLDLARTHYRDHLRSYRADQNSQAALDDLARKSVKELAEILEPIKHKIVGTILGNHYWEFMDGTNSEQYLCQLLNIPYLGPVGIIRVDLADPVNKGGTRDHFTIYAHHHGGSRGGKTTGADVNSLEKAELTFEADIYCLSHTHRRFGFKIPKLGITDRGNPTIRENTKVFIRSGTCLKGYGEDSPTTTKQHVPSYAESQALRPTDLGQVKLTILPKRAHVGNKIVYKLTY